MRLTPAVILLVTFLSACNDRLEVPLETLTVTYTGKGDHVIFQIMDGPSATLITDTTNGTFEATLDVPALEDAIFTYDLTVQRDSAGRTVDVEPDGSLLSLNGTAAVEVFDAYLWIGGHRNEDYPQSDTLLGSLETRQFSSIYLGVDREVTVYTPPEAGLTTPFIYLTDGSGTGYYARYVDRLISEGRISPIKLIGVHSSDDNRYQEYVRGGEDNAAFPLHERFFYEEVIPTLEAEAPGWAGKRYLYGFSNGGAFAIHAGLNHPEVFEEIIAFSTYDYIAAMSQFLYPIAYNFSDYPDFYLGAGRFESVFEDNLSFVDDLRDEDIAVTFTAFTSGHDSETWRIEFLEYLELRFGRDKLSTVN